VALLHSARYQQSLRRYHDKHIRRRDLNIGDLVLRRSQNNKGRHKLTPPWEGPCIVAKVMKLGTYKLSNEKGEIFTNAWNIKQLHRRSTGPIRGINHFDVRLLLPLVRRRVIDGKVDYSQNRPLGWADISTVGATAYTLDGGTTTPRSASTAYSVGWSCYGCGSSRVGRDSGCAASFPLSGGASTTSLDSLTSARPVSWTDVLASWPRRSPGSSRST
jgi:hypothetical protein